MRGGLGLDGVGVDDERRLEARVRLGAVGLVVVDGKLIENLHVEDAKRVLALADAINARGS